ncbi:hypothetical protein B296_00037817 [Ensete ventricosum]|uniref:Uncharacterized protein n=1 Tax=Ensete ventricosum TaxID=4639 RepID=A0A426ZHN4_ENSVE|nr:hypothetical protein B296_00037817 [Ensete ventricosum]
MPLIPPSSLLFVGELRLSSETTWPRRRGSVLPLGSIPFDASDKSTTRRPSWGCVEIGTRRALGFVELPIEMEAVMRAQQPMLTSGASGRVTALLSLRVLRGLLLLLQAAALLLLLPFRWRPRLVSAAERSAPAPADGRPEGSRKGGHGGVVVRVPAAMVPRRQREHDASWRRALAVRRVVEAMKEGQPGRDFSLFTTARGDTLFTQSWTPVNLKTR